jgi:hypothetical protein
LKKSEHPVLDHSAQSGRHVACRNEVIAARAVLIIVDALLKAGANLGTLKIQMAINKAREDVVALLDSKFPREAELRPRRK